MSKTPVIQVRGLTKTFGHERLFSALSFDVNKGEKVVISGESGTGKSTLLNVFTGITRGWSGDIFIFGKRPSQAYIQEIRSQMAWLPQEIPFVPDFTRQLLLKPFEFKRNQSLMPDQEKIDSLLERLGMDPSILEKPLSNISGGQKQRIVLASCILLERPLLLLDEPTSALDDASIQKVADLLLEKPEMTVLTTSHNHAWINQCHKEISLSS